MNRLFVLLLAATALSITSCQEKKQPENTDSQAKVDSLQRIIVQKDNEIDDMMGTMNEIQTGLQQISEAENRVSVMGSSEGYTNSQRIKDDMTFISEQMKRNRELVSKLRQQLRESTVKGNKLKETINGLVQQLDAKDRELQQLRAELNEKNVHIAELDKVVDDLNTSVSSLTEEGNTKSKTIAAQDKQLNTAWYVFGTKKELKDQHIIENGHVLQSSFNKSYFTKLDIRIDKEIKLYSKSASILTSHPSGSYTLEKDANKQYVLRITNPDSFWSTSKYLVILVK
jgi:chromosome segregation ATPase